MLPATVKHYLSTADPVLGRLIASQPKPHQESTRNVFHDLMSCLIEQQIHYRSSKKLFAKLLIQANLTELTPDLFGAFDERALVTTRLSGTKYETIVRVLDIWNQATYDWEDMTDAQVRQTLGAIKGIGTWTVDMILLYTLQRPSIFPADDYHLQQVMTRLYALDPGSGLKARMRAVASRWGAHQSLAVRYLLDSKKPENNHLLLRP